MRMQKEEINHIEIEAVEKGETLGKRRIRKSL